jgi:hypothetical protein
MILIGSMALAHHVDIGRVPADVDILGAYDEIMKFRQKVGIKVCYPINEGRSIYMRNDEGTIIEAEVCWEDSMAERLNNFIRKHDDWGVTGNDWLVPSLDMLYLLKLSHRYKKDSPHFKKTLDDILFMRKLGAKIRPEHEEFFKQREKETYTNSAPKLNVSRADFFDSNVTGVVQVYQHDAVHEAVKHLDRPAYEYFKPNTAEVMCSKAMFEKCSDEVKLYSVVEEAMVLAIERSLSVFPGKKTPREAFEMALMKCCTSIASGWWREFAWENYYNVMDLFHEDFYDKFMEKVEQGLVEYKDGNK